MQNSSQNSYEESSNQSSASSEGSSGESTAHSSDDSSGGGNAPQIILAISCTLVAIGLTAGGIALTVKASRVKKQDAIGLQDQIYRSEGPEYEEILSFFEVDPETLGRIQDELVAEGALLDTDQAAADYIALLILRLAESSEKVKTELSLLRAAVPPSPGTGSLPEGIQPEFEG